jgi:Xaa-Pro aminopeptidase
MAGSLRRDVLNRGELERRWGLLRGLLRARSLDALVTQGANTHSGIGGYFRWITGSSVPGAYPRSVVFSRDEAMTLISHGAAGGDVRSDPDSDESPGVERRMSAPMFPMVHYTAAYDAQCVLTDLRTRGARRVGLAGASTFAHGFAATLAAADDLEWEDVTDDLDTFKAIKSDQEIEYCRATARMQDSLIEAARDCIRPGMREFEVATELTRLAALAGSFGGFILTTSGALDERGPPMFPRTAEMQGRTLAAGDLVLVLIENSGPSGYTTHIGRMYSLGEPSREILEAHATILAEQDALAKDLVPGASPARLFDAYNTRMRQRGLAEETRVHAHGQGYEIVERPLIRSDETMSIAERMNIGIHPMIITRRVLVTAVDNYMTGVDGAERLHQSPRTIFEIRP